VSAYATLPDGPRDPPWLMTALWLTRPTRVLQRCARKYGNTFTVRFTGVPPLVMYAQPDAVKEIFTGPPDELYAGEANVVLEPILGQHSVLLLDGERHMRQRRLLLPPFHGQRMRAYGETIQAIARRQLASWRPGAQVVAAERGDVDAVDGAFGGVWGGDAHRAAQYSAGALMLAGLAQAWVWGAGASTGRAGRGPRWRSGGSR